MDARKPSLGKPLFVYLLPGLVCLALSLLIGWSSYGDRINHIFYDLYFRQRGALPVADNIVIVGIDDATLAEYGPLPLDRSRLARGIEALRQAQVHVIVLDMLLTDPGDPEEDEALARALATPAHSESLVLATALDTSGQRWLKPLPSFAAAASAVGHVHWDPDGDGVSRRVLLEQHSGRERYWALTVECFRAAIGTTSDPITETDEELGLPGVHGPFQVPARRRDGRSLLINYAGGNGTFPEISFASLGKDPSVPSRLKGKTVFLGVTAQGTGDRLF
ncbi:MAG TPA: CHASE2 domain-containing protein, partial [Terriglobia bacterium]